MEGAGIGLEKVISEICDYIDAYNTSPKRTSNRGQINVSAAGLRHSRDPFSSERDCAESQSQQYQ
jgi:hypothetical protein